MWGFFFYFQTAKVVLARIVTNEEHSNEFWLAQSCIVAKCNSRSTTFYWLARRGMQNKQAVFSIIGWLEKGEKGTNFLAEYGVSKQQISDIHKNKETSMKFADILETSEGLKRKSLKVAHDEQLDKALYAWFIQQRTARTPISGPPNN